MKRICLIASYGGSGSTYLAKQIKNQYKEHFKVVHTHSPVNDGFVGYPLWNFVTGHAEGPFSKYLPLPPGSKIIVVHRKPAEAYLSRCCFKHFMHIWSDTDWFREVIGNDTKQDDFQSKFSSQWKKFIEDKVDILNLNRYLTSWVSYAAQSDYDLAIVRYENLNDSWSELMTFMGGEDQERETFTPVNRHIPQELDKMFEEADKISRSLPNISIYKARDTRQILPAIKNINSVFTITGLNAGFGDSLSRLATAYDLVTSLTGMNFKYSRYNNYHCDELDFFDKFGITRSYSAISDEELNSAKSINFSEFLYRYLHDEEFVEEGIVYNISADLYPGSNIIHEVKELVNINCKFIDSLSYSPKQKDIFSKAFNTKKIVAHLRRGDICADLFSGEDVEEHPSLSQLHRRKILNIDQVVDYLSRKFPDESIDFEIVLVSDGVEHLKRRFEDAPQITRVLVEEEHRLKFPKGLGSRFKVINTLIGRSEELTISTLDAMSSADIVITASSCFPNQICKINNVQLVHLW